MRKMGGAFQPFEKERHVPLPTTSAGAMSSTAGVSSGAAATSGGACVASEIKDIEEKEGEKEMELEKKEKEKEKEKEKGKDEQSQNNRKPRRCWSPELHRRFLHALQQLGGSHGLFII